MRKIDEIIKIYKTLKIYKDKGHQNSILINKVDGIEIKYKITFETKFNRKKGFGFKYVKFNKQNEIELNGMIINENNLTETKSIIEFVGIETIEQEIPLSMAISSHTGISQKVSYIV